jgi:ketopantoate reductase
MDAAGINTIFSDDIEAEEWSKFVGWVALLVVSVIARTDTGNTLANPYFAKMAAVIIYEASLIASKQGVSVIDRAPFPVATISSIPLEQATRAVVRIGEDFIREAPDHRMSAVQDLTHGRELEVEETLGFLRKEAKLLGLDCPCLEMAYNIVSGVNQMQGFVQK